MLALTGYGTAHLAPRLLSGTDPVLHYAGLFAMRPRSADRLGAMLSDWLGMQVEVVEFAGAWLNMPPDQRTRIGVNGVFNRMAMDAAIGIRAWDPQARLILRIGPLKLPGFSRLLPDRLALHRLVSLVRAYLGYELGFAINPVLAAREIPPLRLDRGRRLAAAPGLEHLAAGPAEQRGAAEGRGGCDLRGGSDRGAADRRKGTHNMSGWGGGYVTDITYMLGWYRQQSPTIIALAALLGGVAAELPGPDDPVQYLELGCGQGYGAMLLAASNPTWRVTAVDFNPAHIAAAREWAAAGGLTNITFLEADLTTLAEEPAGRALPQFDFVSLHGLWSWIPKAAQDGIVRLLRDKVRPGGAVHLSYNALPAWGSALGMARLLRTAGRQLAWRSDRQAEEGLKLVRDLLAAEALQLRRSPMAQGVISRLDSLPSSYLAHEYMNENWAPCYHADVASALSDAKLDWVASGNLSENFPDLTLTPEQRAITQKFDDPLLRELIKDLCLDRTLRHDVFVRGARRISAAARDAVLRQIHLGLNMPPADLPLEADMPAGRAQLSPGFYKPIAEALVGGPRRVGELLDMPTVEGKRDNPAELVGILVGLDFSEPILRPDAAAGPEALRFNRATVHRLLRLEPLGRPLAAASYRVGMAVPSTLLDLLVLDRTLDGHGGVEDLVDFMRPLVNDEAKLREVLTQSISGRQPILRASGVF